MSLNRVSFSPRLDSETARDFRDKLFSAVAVVAAVVVIVVVVVVVVIVIVVVFAVAPEDDFMQQQVFPIKLFDCV